MSVEKQKSVKSLKSFFFCYYNVLLDETKVFDIKSSKTWVLLLQMEFLRDLKVFFFEFFMFHITGTKLEKDVSISRKFFLCLFDVISKLQ